MRAGWWMVALCACGPASDEDDGAPDRYTRLDTPWERPDVRPELGHGVFERHPQLKVLSLFAQSVSGPEGERPLPSHRGAYGVGNGNAFALLGLTDPLNTLHGLVGPTYNKRSRFYGDVGFRLVVDGEEVAFDTESIARPRGTAMAITRADAGPHTLYTIDFAPWLPDVDGVTRPPGLVRVLALSTTATGDHTFELVLDAYDTWSAGDDGPVLSAGGDDERVAALVSLDGAWTEGEAWRLPLGTLDGPGELRADLAIGALGGSDEVAAFADLMRGADVDWWMDLTASSWRDETSSGLQIELDDPWVTDLLDGLRVGVLVQRSEAGGISPLNRYTGTWLRDSIGPVRFWSRLGLHDRAEEAMAYLELCHRHRGGIGNSCTSGLRPEDVQREVDWPNQGPLGGRTAAEGPSYLALGWKEVAQWSGDPSVVTDRWAYLKHAVADQVIDEEGRQPWSGDETFRLAMNVALGAPLEHPWQDLAWSSNSAHVFLPAARYLRDVAKEAGWSEDAKLFDGLATRVQSGLETHFIRPEGHFAALILRDASANPLDQPFEDSALKAIWAGAYPAESDVAQAAFRGLLDVAGRGDGSIQSRPDAQYLGTDAVGDGVGTGMLPGYALYNFTAFGHPELREAFRQLLAYASPSGQYNEGFSYSDRSAIHYVYDRGGTIGDLAARYRPWEGGIVGDALLHHLVGATPDGVVRPRVPNGGAQMVARSVRTATGTFDLDVRWSNGAASVNATNVGDAPATLTLELPLEDWRSDLQIGSEGPSEAALVRAPMGEAMAVFAPVSIEPGASVRFLVTVR